jgi:hypothetical protein
MDILNEVWVPVVGFEDSSEVSNFGNVRTIDRLIIRSNGRKCFYKGQDLKPMIRAGYPSVTLPDPISAKLTRNDVVIIRDRLAKGDSPEKIASNYGVKGSTIRNINRFRTWNHI